MLYLHQLLDQELLAEMIARGYVRRNVAPGTGSMAIYNYTDQATYDRVWNDVTRQCRGLITAREGLGEEYVIARPWPKFHNHGEQEASAIDFTGPVNVTDKADGSLGILYPRGNGYAIATRGSLVSDQAEHAIEVWNERYAARVQVPSDLTLLFEIIFPSNRIVLDYGSMDDLILLGAIEIETGCSLTPGEARDAAGWPGPVVEAMPYQSFEEALAAAPRPEKEGVVVHFVATDQRVKLKQADYLALHKIISGLNERAVWEWLGAGTPLADLIHPLPDEFHEWVRTVAADLETQQDAILKDAQIVFHDLKQRIAAEVSGTDCSDSDYRRRFAQLAALSEHRHLLFLMLDGRPAKPSIWRTLRPGVAKPGQLAPAEAVSS